MYNLAQETLFDAKKIIENSTASQEYVFYEMLCYSDIGYLYRLQGKLQDALEMYEKVSPIIVDAHRIGFGIKNQTLWRRITRSCVDVQSYGTCTNITWKIRTIITHVGKSEKHSRKITRRESHRDSNNL